MRIIHVLEDFSLNSGGIRTVVKDLNDKLINSGIESLIVSGSYEVTDKIIKIDGGTNPWNYSKNLTKVLKEICNSKEDNIIHIHGVWMNPQYSSAKFAYENNIPFILSCHGMYEPWLWTKGTLKKKIYFKMFAKPAFSKANYIHAITNNEALELKKLFINSNIAQIPNLIDLRIDEEVSYSPKEKYILYLGRLDKKKGIDILIQAFKNIEQEDLKLYIAGEFNEYKSELVDLAISLRINDKIKFLGQVLGKEKRKIYRNAYAFVAPSHSEVIGMVNLEAAMERTPVITTYQTGISESWNHNGGILINPKEKELTSALKKVLSWSDNERLINGKNLQMFVINNYSWENRFKDWMTLYKSML